MNLKVYLLLLLSGIMVYSCTETIEMDLNKGENNHLVVEGSITTELKTHQVKLSRTSDYYYNQPAVPELGAKVQISDGDTLITLTDAENNGIYKTQNPCAGKVNHVYKLNIELQDGQTYFASDTIRPINTMDSIKYEYVNSKFPFDTNHYYNINLYAKESPKSGEYYQWELYLNGNHVTDTLRLKVFVSDDFVNGSYITNWTVYDIPAYKIKKDTNDITLQMLSISKEKYDFFTAILLETDYSGGPFSGSPANVPTNISNGALGLFSASAVTESKIKLFKVRSKSLNTIPIKKQSSNYHIQQQFRKLPGNKKKCDV